MRRGTHAVWALAVLVLVPAMAMGEKRESIAELTNFALGSEYSQWLVGPMSRIASSSETDRYLHLTEDNAAAAFIDEFWQRRRDPSNPWPDQQPRAVFDRRAQEADRSYTEGVTRGRRTDRGEIYVVYGPPPEIDYEDEPDPRYGSIEIWRYGRKAERGLDGEKPKKQYRFVKARELTVFYTPTVKLQPGLPRRGVIQ